MVVMLQLAAYIYNGVRNSTSPEQMSSYLVLTHFHHVGFIMFGATSVSLGETYISGRQHNCPICSCCGVIFVFNHAATITLYIQGGDIYTFTLLFLFVPSGT